MSETELEKLMSRCKFTIYITVNAHKNDYMSVEEWFSKSDSEFMEELGVLLQELIDRDTVIEVQAYPLNPIGSYRVFHYDLESACKLINEAIEAENA